MTSSNVDDAIASRVADAEDALAILYVVLSQNSGILSRVTDRAQLAAKHRTLAIFTAHESTFLAGCLAVATGAIARALDRANKDPEFAQHIYRVGIQAAEGAL